MLRKSVIKILLATLLLPAPLAAQTDDVPVLLAEERRTEFVEELEELLNYEDPLLENELMLVPDPFRFERDLPEEKTGEERDIGNVPVEEVLANVGSKLREDVIGYQEFGGSALIATRNFGLLREGRTLDLRVSGLPNETIEITVGALSRRGFHIRFGDKEIFVPLTSEQQGIRPSSQ